MISREWIRDCDKYKLNKSQFEAIIKPYAHNQWQYVITTHKGLVEEGLRNTLIGAKATVEIILEKQHGIRV